DLSKVQNGTETRLRQKNPFKEIISALRSSISLVPSISANQQSPLLPPGKRKRLSAMEYDPSFPTTNPEEFEKNDIGI
ncbi:hypothetical protein WUBG_16771, partial [Wuchereria bancrofti]